MFHLQKIPHVATSKVLWQNYPPCRLSRDSFEGITEAGAKIMLDSEVINVDSVKRQVTLKSGKLITGNVIVGADGESSCLDLYVHNGCIS